MKENIKIMTYAIILLAMGIFSAVGLVKAVDEETEPVIWSNDTQHYGSNYSLVNLTLDTEDIEGPRLLLTIKNEDVKPIAQANLTILINGWMTNWFKVGLTNGLIGVGKETTIDLTNTLKNYYENPRNSNRPKDKLSFRIFSKENESHLNALIYVSEDTLNKLEIKETQVGLSPSPWKLAYKIVDLRAEKDAAGEYKYYLKVRNDSSDRINQMNLDFIVNGKFSNFGQFGTFLPAPGTEKEYDVTFNANCFANKEAKVKHFYIIGSENDDYFEKTISLE